MLISKKFVLIISKYNFYNNNEQSRVIEILYNDKDTLIQEEFQRNITSLRQSKAESDNIVQNRKKTKELTK